MKAITGRGWLQLAMVTSGRLWSALVGSRHVKSGVRLLKHELKDSKGSSK